VVVKCLPSQASSKPFVVNVCVEGQRIDMEIAEREFV
jgi:hypothetical protein